MVGARANIYINNISFIVILGLEWSRSSFGVFGDVLKDQFPVVTLCLTEETAAWQETC